MFLKITLLVFALFIFFQLLYIFIPLFSIKSNILLKKVKWEKGISILIPAYNEEKVIMNCISGVLNLNYKNFEAIIVNDGSTDGTLELLKDNLQLEPVYERLPAVKLHHESIREIYRSASYPKIYVIDKPNGGKADALNAGIEYAKKDIIITLDADSVLDYNSLNAINSTFADEKVLAAGGMVQIGQGFKGEFQNPQPTFILSGLLRFQVVQYMTNFYLQKFTQTKFKSLTVISGAFGAFRKEVLYEVDGYRKTVGEDMDITMKIHQLINTKYKKHKLLFVPQALCYTEGPENFKNLFGQRIRWQKAFIDCVFNYRKAFFKQLGIRLSFYILVDSLLLGTLVAFVVIFLPIVLIINPQYYMIVLGFLTVTFVLALYQGLTMVIVSRRYNVIFPTKDYFKMSLFIPLEIVTYRLLGILFVTIGTVSYFINKDKWHVTKRIGTNHQTFEKKIIPNKKAI